MSVMMAIFGFVFSIFVIGLREVFLTSRKSPQYKDSIRFASFFGVLSGILLFLLWLFYGE